MPSNYDYMISNYENMQSNNEKIISNNENTQMFYATVQANNNEKMQSNNNENMQSMNNEDIQASNDENYAIQENFENKTSTEKWNTQSEEMYRFDAKECELPREERNRKIEETLRLMGFKSPPLDDVKIEEIIAKRKTMVEKMLTLHKNKEEKFLKKINETFEPKEEIIHKEIDICVECLALNASDCICDEIEEESVTERYCCDECKAETWQLCECGIGDNQTKIMINIPQNRSKLKNKAKKLQKKNALKKKKELNKGENMNESAQINLIKAVDKRNKKMKNNVSNVDDNEINAQSENEENIESCNEIDSDNEEKNNGKDKLPLTGTKENLRYIKMKCAQVNNGSFKGLIDSGCAKISVIREKALKPEVEIHSNKARLLQGLHSQERAIGAVYLYIAIGRKKSPFEFQVIPEASWPLSDKCEAIIGLNILKNAKIDLSENMIYFSWCDEKEKPLGERLKDKLINKKLDKSFIKELAAQTNESNEIMQHERLPRIDFPQNGSRNLQDSDNEEDDDEKLKKCLMDLEKRMKVKIPVMIINKGETETRMEQIKKLIDIDHLNDEQKSIVNDLIMKYNKVFKLESDKLPMCDLVKISLQLKTTKPVYHKQYALGPEKTKIVEAQIREWEKEDIIEKSNGTYNSPLCVVMRKNGKPRVCCDLRAVNAVLKTCNYGLPKISELVMGLGQFKYICLLDLPNAFNAIKISEESREILGFKCGNQHFQYKRMPFGLALSSGAFCFAIDKLLNSVLGKRDSISEKGEKTFICTQAYIDDIIVVSDDFKSCVKGVEDVMELFVKHNVTINPQKTKWFVEEALFLGYHLKDGKVGINEDKVQAIKQILPPKNQTEVKSFLACVGYYRHILNTNLSEIEAPIIELLRKNTKFNWTSKCQESFEKIKEILSSKPVVESIDETETHPLVIMSDASSTGLGGCLSILKDEILKPVAYFSRVLKTSEKNYSIYMKEFLALTECVKHFHFQVIGRTFNIIVDNLALSYMLKAKYDVLDDQILRQHLKLSKYNFKIIFVKGIHNCLADTLSRMGSETEPNKSNEKKCIVSVVMTRNRQKQQMSLKNNQAINKNGEETEEDKVISNNVKPKIMGRKSSKDSKDGKDVNKNLKDVKNNTSSNDVTGEGENSDIEEDKRDKKIEETISYSNTRPRKIEDKDEQKALIKKFHNSCHAGIARTLLLIKKHFVWKNMRKQVRNFVNACNVCCTCKHSSEKRIPLRLISEEKELMNTIHVDLIGPFDESEGNRYGCIVVEALSRMIIASPIEDKRPETVARMLLQDVFLKFGVPNICVSDRGSEFTSRLSKAFLKKAGVEMRLTSSYHPQSNALVERSNKSIKNAIRCLMLQEKKSWTQVFAYAIFYINITPSVTLGNYSPSEIFFGRILKPFLTGQKKVKEELTINDFVNNHIENMNKTKNIAKIQKDAMRIKNKINYDKKCKWKDIKVGQEIFYKKFARKSLEPVFTGPYIVSRILSERNIGIMIKGKEKIVHIDQVKKRINEDDEEASSESESDEN